VGLPAQVGDREEREMKMYMITEPYDGSHVRILACSRTPEVAERQLDREAAARCRRGYTFFQPIRRLVSTRREVEALSLDRRLVDLPPWELA
jgi:hypothetical protein